MKNGKCENCGNEYKDILTHKRYCDKFYHYKDDVIKLYNSGLSIKSISEKLKISKTRVSFLLGDKVRTTSESCILAHKMYPEKFKHTEESKNKLREKRLEWMKNNPEKTAWRLSNFSYPEKLMFNKFLEIDFDKKYLIIREKSFFPYFIDFAFENEKIALEIDGSQHLLPERKMSDDEKDRLLVENGWRVIRVTDFEVKNNIDNIIRILEYELNNTDYKNNKKNIKKIGILKYKKIKNEIDITKKIKKVGIIKEVKKYIKKERNEIGFTAGQIKSILKQRRVERPSLDILKIEINELGLEGTGRKYGVTGNAIKKWIKTYNKLKI